MFVTWILSMCISNTSTTAMMIPIVISVLDQLHEGERKAVLEKQELKLKNDKCVEVDEIVESSKKIDSNTDDTKEQVLTNISSSNLPDPELPDHDLHDQDLADPKEEFFRTPLDIGLLLCIPYAASIGGTGTFTGTGLNPYLAGFYKDYYGQYAIPGSGYEGHSG